jgi:hypothetical protein
MERQYSTIAKSFITLASGVNLIKKDTLFQVWPKKLQIIIFNPSLIFVTEAGGELIIGDDISIKKLKRKT